MSSPFLQIVITEFQESDLEEVKVFCDRWIGENYYQHADLEKIREQSQKMGVNASFLAWSQRGGDLIGVRLSLAPGSWSVQPSRITPQAWSRSLEQVGYFKSLFVHPNFQGQGLGRALSLRSKEALIQQGASGIVTHSWLESPQNSSQRYLKKFGFKEIARHPGFWVLQDYHCSLCAPSPCVCTAVEMFLEL